MADLRLLASGAIGRMAMAGLTDYGRVPRDRQGIAEMAMVWADVLADRGVRPETIEPTSRAFASRGGDFPSAGAFATECERMRGEMFVLIGVELQDGSLFVAELPVAMSRAERHAEAERLALGGKVPLALPEDTRSGEEMVPMSVVREHLSRIWSGRASGRSEVGS